MDLVFLKSAIMNKVLPFSTMALSLVGKKIADTIANTDFGKNVMNEVDSILISYGLKEEPININGLCILGKFAVKVDQEDVNALIEQMREEIALENISNINSLQSPPK